MYNLITEILLCWLIINLLMILMQSVSCLQILCVSSTVTSHIPCCLYNVLLLLPLPVCIIPYFSTESRTCHTFSLRCHCLWKVLSLEYLVISWCFLPSWKSWILPVLLYFLVTNLLVLSVQDRSWDWDNDFNIHCMNRESRSEITFYSYSWWLQTFLIFCGRGHSW